MDINPHKADAPESALIASAVASRVREAMATAGLTQVTLSAATAIPQPTISRRLTGLSPFTLPELAAVASALGVQTSELVRQAEKGVAA